MLQQPFGLRFSLELWIDIFIVSTDGGVFTSDQLKLGKPDRLSRKESHTRARHRSSLDVIIRLDIWLLLRCQQCQSHLAGPVCSFPLFGAAP